MTGGEHDPLFPYLTEELTRSTRADIAVGFAMRSGVEHIQAHLLEFLTRRGRLRLVTGDYLGITDPDALTRLLDLQGDRHIRIFETETSPGPASPGPPPPLVFHPKAYVFQREDGTGVAFVGSSNLSASALTTGIEWSYRTVSSAEGNAFASIGTGLEALFAHPATCELTSEWIDRYRKRRPTLQRTSRAPAPAESDRSRCTPKRNWTWRSGSGPSVTFPPGSCSCRGSRGARLLGDRGRHRDTSGSHARARCGTVWPAASPTLTPML